MFQQKIKELIRSIKMMIEIKLVRILCNPNPTKESSTTKKDLTKDTSTILHNKLQYFALDSAHLIIKNPELLLKLSEENLNRWNDYFSKDHVRNTLQDICNNKIKPMLVNPVKIYEGLRITKKNAINVIKAYDSEEEIKAIKYYDVAIKTAPSLTRCERLTAMIDKVNRDPNKVTWCPYFIAHVKRETNKSNSSDNIDLTH